MKLKCVEACHSPGLGAWKPGDIVEDPGLVEKLKASECFQPAEE